MDGPPRAGPPTGSEKLGAAGRGPPWGRGAPCAAAPRRRAPPRLRLSCSAGGPGDRREERQAHQTGGRRRRQAMRHGDLQEPSVDYTCALQAGQSRFCDAGRKPRPSGHTHGRAGARRFARTGDRTLNPPRRASTGAAGRMQRQRTASASRLALARSTPGLRQIQDLLRQRPGRGQSHCLRRAPSGRGSGNARAEGYGPRSRREPARRLDAPSRPVRCSNADPKRGRLPAIAADCWRHRLRARDPLRTIGPLGAGPRASDGRR